MAATTAFHASLNKALPPLPFESVPSTMNNSSATIATKDVNLINPVNTVHLALSPSRSSGGTASSSTLAGTSATSTPPSSIASIDALDEKKAKRKAKREMNRLRRRAEVEAQAEAPKPQLWEEALDQVQIPARTTEKDPQITPPPPGVYDIDNPHAVAYVEHLLSLYGKWNITFLDPSYRIFLTENAALSFNVIRTSGQRVAVVFGNPLCPPEDLEETICSFRAACKSKGWGLAFVGVREDVVAVAHKHKWATVHFSDEPIIDPATNPVLDGTAGRRTLLHVKKLAKSGSLKICPPGTASPELQERLQALYDQCYAARNTPYSTKLRLFSLKEQVTYFYLGDDENPTAVAGLIHTANSAVIDPCVATPEAPPAATDFLTLMAMGYARRLGIRCSFGPEPLRTVDVQGMSSAMERGARLVGAAAYDAFSFEGKRILHDKFHPASKEKLFVVLAYRRTLGQSVSAMAVWEATHLHGSEVVAPFFRILKSKFEENGFIRHMRRTRENPVASSSSEVTLADDD